MNKGKKPTKEPFRPENTPKPPQQIHPHPRKKEPGGKGQPKNPPASGPSHLLSDQADIDDETTI